MSQIVTPPAGALTELTLTRLIDAPRDLVYAAWTDPKQIALWWGPHSFTVPFCRADVRVGGELQIVMRGPSGTVGTLTGTYREVTPPERLVYTTRAMEDEHGVPLFEGRTTLTLADEGGKTRLTLFLEVISAQPAAMAALAGKEAGWNQALDRLLAHANSRFGAAASFTFPSDHEYTMVRAFEAQRELVFEAMTNPQHVRSWWPPEGMELDICEIDLRVGGGWRYVMDMPDGSTIEFFGEFKEVERPARLVYTEIFAPYPDAPSLVTTLYDEIEGRTIVTCTVSFPSPEVLQMVLQTGMQEGANASYDRLAALLAAGRTD